MSNFNRGLPPEKEKLWRKMYAKEDNMKLNWFHKNQQRLIEITMRTQAEKMISPEVLAEVTKMRQERYRNAERFPRQKGKDGELPDLDPKSILNVMKPVDVETKDILYTNTEAQGRKLYLKARQKIPPPDRYYFPEKCSFIYGWDANAKPPEKAAADVGEAAVIQEAPKRFGRCQVIKASFYRRNGALKADSVGMRCPAQDSPTVCNA